MRTIFGHAIVSAALLREMTAVGDRMADALEAEGERHKDAFGIPDRLREPAQAWDEVMDELEATAR